MGHAAADLETAHVTEERREDLRSRKQREEEEEDEEEEIGRYKRITPKLLKKLIKEQHLFNTPSLNDKLYLHYHGFLKMEGLEAWTGCAPARAPSARPCFPRTPRAPRAHAPVRARAPLLLAGCAPSGSRATASRRSRASRR
jgi:hypothetical protein